MNCIDCNIEIKLTSKRCKSCNALNKNIKKILTHEQEND